MGDEFEIVPHKSVSGLQVLLVNLLYREPHVHSDLECCYVLSGEAVVTSRNQELILKKDDFVVFNSCQPHEIRSYGKEGVLFLTVQAQTGFCREYYPALSDMEFTFCIGNQCFPERERGEFRKKILELARGYFAQGPGFEFGCIGLLNLLLRDMVKYLPREPGTEAQKQALCSERVNKLLRYLETHFQEKLLLSELAREEGLTVSYLSHFFKDHFQVSFQEYLAGLRCEKARHLLRFTDHKLLDISMESGFSDVKYMNRAFRERYGCTPREYRQKSTLTEIHERTGRILSTQGFFSFEESLAMLPID